MLFGKRILDLRIPAHSVYAARRRSQAVLACSTFAKTEQKAVYGSGMGPAAGDFGPSGQAFAHFDVR
jgi:hypothetical protein